ncbi:MAG TPA: hypothetical protein VFP49_07600, partial [Nitrososphaeraceae archaeon]|nr:hypothetical protein [Nitrososphaeraceae archaeon]
SSLFILQLNKRKHQQQHVIRTSTESRRLLTQGENRHSKNIDDEEIDNEKLVSNLKSKIKEELEKSDREQQILLKENKQTIIDFLIDNKDSIRIEDLKIYDLIYKCIREKGKCHICNSLSNIICKNCNNHNYNKEVWLYKPL